MTKQQLKRLKIVLTIILLLSGFIMAENEAFLNVERKYLYCNHETDNTFCSEIEPRDIYEQKTPILSYPENYYVAAYLVGQSKENIVAYDRDYMSKNNTIAVTIPGFIEHGIEKKISIGNSNCILDMQNKLYFYKCNGEIEIFSFKNPNTQDKYERINNYILKEKNNINNIIKYTYYLTLFGPVLSFFFFLRLLSFLKTIHKYIMTGRFIDK